MDGWHSLMDRVDMTCLQRIYLDVYYNGEGREHSKYLSSGHPNELIKSDRQTD